MVLYQCEHCGYTTDRKNNLKNHLNRKNKCFLVKNSENETTVQFDPHKPSQKKKKPSQTLTNSHILPNFPHKPSQIDPHKPSQTLTNFNTLENNNSEFKNNEKYANKINEIYNSENKNNEIKNIYNTEITELEIKKNEICQLNLEIKKNSIDKEKEYYCESCGKYFKRKDNLKRHKERYCRALNDLKNENKQLIEEKLILEKKLEQLNSDLINKPTQIINNTININGFGNENLGYLSNQYIRALLSVPFNALPKLIKDIHCNPDHPENHNIKKTNKKDKLISIYQDGKWIYEDKNKLLDNLMDEKMAILENSVDDTLDAKKLERFEDFKGQYYKDESLKASNISEAELIILNNS